jgi:hypothetical protein
VWTSHREAELVAVVRSPTQVNKYRFGTRTADFYICTQCGVVPWVVSEIETRQYAVVNVNTLANVDGATLARTIGSFDGEGVDDRLARRVKNWIPKVFLCLEG